MDAMTASHARQPERNLAKWQLALVVTGVTVVALVLAAYAAAGSYDSLWHLAQAHGVPLPRLNPVGLDGGLVGVILLSVGLTWAGHPIGWLRQAARLFAFGTVAANAAAGWPDPVGVFLRIFAPLLLVLISEAVHSVLLARSGEHRDPIPFMRWVLAPPSTFRLWRRMVLWRVHSYAEAVEMELSRLRAIQALTAHYKGKDWHQAAPQDVVWMLRRGVKMPEALAAVAELTAPPKAEPFTGTTTRKPARNKPRKRAAAPTPVPVPVAAGSSAPEDAPGLDAEALILKYLAEGHSASQAGIMAGKSDSYGRQVARLAKAAKQEPAGTERAEGDMS